MFISFAWKCFLLYLCECATFFRSTSSHLSLAKLSRLLQVRLILFRDVSNLPCEEFTFINLCSFRTFSKVLFLKVNKFLTPCHSIYEREKLWKIFRKLIKLCTESDKLKIFPFFSLFRLFIICPYHVNKHEKIKKQ